MGKRTLAILGCGKVGKSLGRLWHQGGIYSVTDVLNRTKDRADQAVHFIGAGRGVISFRDLHYADVFMISAADSGIVACCESLARAGVVRPGTVVFHCSGALSSSVLTAVSDQGAYTASVHPVRSFAIPLETEAMFSGTWCGVEGTDQAVAIVTDALSVIGGKPFLITPEFKAIYHSGSVFACNYLTALIEVGVRMYEKGGLTRETALQVMEPLVKGTVENIFRFDTAKALTGPISRGDGGIVADHLQALDAWDREAAHLYRALGRVAVTLAIKQGHGQRQDLARIETMLAETD